MACDRIAGAHRLYYAPYGAASTTYLGQTGPEGITQIREILTQEITGDQLGPGAVIDHVYQGENLSIEFVVQEVNKDIVQMFLHPFQCTYLAGIATAARQEDYGVAGRLGCAVYGVLEAIPVAFTPAQAFTGGSAAGTAGVYPGTAATTPMSGRQYRGVVVGNVTDFLDTRARFIPISFKCYPFNDTLGDETTTLKHWEWISTFTPSGLTW
jgi:hypothetical protein